MDNNLIHQLRDIQPSRPVTERPVKKRQYDINDGILSIAALMLGRRYVKIAGLYTREFLMYFPIFTIVYILAIAAYARSKGVRINSESYVWAAVMVISARVIKTTTFIRLVMTTLTAVYFTLCAGGALHSKTTGRYLTIDLFNGFIAHPFGNFFTAFPAFFSLFKNGTDSREKPKTDKKKALRIISGLLLAAIAFSVVLPLLFSADNNFKTAIDKFAGSAFRLAMPEFDLALFFINTVFTAPFVLYIYGLIYGSFNQDNPSRISRQAAEKARNSARVSPALTMNILIWAVCALYLLFIVFQANYLFGAFTGNLYPGLTYSRYAVKGFWELWWVCIVNLAILALTNLFISRQEAEKLKTPRTALCLLSLLLLSTAAAKMGMYICAYGLTDKRIISSAVLLWMIIVFRLCIAASKRRFNLTKACVYTGLVIYCVVFCADTYSISKAFNQAFGYEVSQRQNNRLSDYLTPSLPRATELKYIDIVDSNGDSLAFFDYQDIIRDILTNLETARYTNESVSDTPVNTDYYTICFVFDDGSLLSDPHGSIVYFYEKNGHYYLEQPYNGIFRLGDVQGAVIMGYIAPANIASVDDKEYVDPYGKLIFYRYVNDEYAYLENFDRVYVPYCVANRKYFGKELGYCDIPAGDYSGRARDIIYKFEEYPIDQWIIVYSPYDNIGMLYREISATDAPYGLESEYSWNK